LEKPSLKHKFKKQKLVKTARLSQNMNPIGSNYQPKKTPRVSRSEKMKIQFGKMKTKAQIMSA